MDSVSSKKIVLGQTVVRHPVFGDIPLKVVEEAPSAGQGYYKLEPPPGVNRNTRFTAHVGTLRLD